LLSFFLFSRGDKRNGKLIFLFGVVSWTIWLNRNDLVFNSKSIATPKGSDLQTDFFFVALGDSGDWVRKGGAGATH
jgi:hypothetical protein